MNNTEQERLKSMDFTSFESAIKQLEKSIKYASSPMAEDDSGLFEQLRNSVIQCFKFTYELSVNTTWKLSHFTTWKVSHVSFRRTD